MTNLRHGKSCSAGRRLTDRWVHLDLYIFEDSLKYTKQTNNAALIRLITSSESLLIQLLELRQRCFIYF